MSFPAWMGLQVVFLAVAWFGVSAWEAGLLTYRQHKWGDGFEYPEDPWFTGVRMFTTMVVFNALFFVMPWFLTGGIG